MMTRVTIPSSRRGTPPTAGDLGPMSPKGWSFIMICIYKLSMRSFPPECIRQTDGHYPPARPGISKDTRTCFSDRSKHLRCGLLGGGGTWSGSALRSPLTDQVHLPRLHGRLNTGQHLLIFPPTFPAPSPMRRKQIQRPGTFSLFVPA